MEDGRLKLSSWNVKPELGTALRFLSYEVRKEKEDIGRISKINGRMEMIRTIHRSPAESGLASNFQVLLVFLTPSKIAQ